MLSLYFQYAAQQCIRKVLSAVVRFQSQHIGEINRTACAAQHSFRHSAGSGRNRIALVAVVSCFQSYLHSNNG